MQKGGGGGVGVDLQGDKAGDSLPEEVPDSCLLVAPHRQALRRIIGALAVALPKTLPAPAIWKVLFNFGKFLFICLLMLRHRHRQKQGQRHRIHTHKQR